MTTATSPRLGAARQLELVAVEVAALAARLVLDSVGAAQAAATKSSPTDVVTHTDVASEQLIRRELTLRCPGSSFLGEESGSDSGVSGVGWIVDPIDGTVNFLYDLPVVSVSIAATIDGEVVAGAVADVLRGEMFSATKGQGARRNESPIGTSDVDRLDLALIGTGFSYDQNVRSEEARIVASLLPRCRDIRCMGSAALNLCWVGCGRLEGFYERDIKVYDYSAGALIAAEGGAQVQLPRDNDTDLTIAAAPAIFTPLHTLV